MRIIRNNDVKVYDLTQRKTFPYWLNERKRRKLMQTDKELEQRIELLQDFDMPVAATNIEITPDCNYILSTGLYKPRIKCHDIYEFSLKFERCMDHEINKFCILNEDYSKLVLLQNNRYIELHAQDAAYYRLALPSTAHDIIYDNYTCDLNIASDESQIYRLNLETGQFYQPYVVDNSCSFSSMALNYDYHFLLGGTRDGFLCGFDPRMRELIFSTDILTINEIDSTGISTLSFRDGINLGIGTDNGIVSLFDIRTNKSLIQKDHMYSESIKKILFLKTLNDHDLVVSADSHSLKLWNRSDASMFTAIQPSNPINDFCIYPNSGLILFANESPKSNIYFIPNIGSAPKWCSYLDNLTEELEETENGLIYDDYKFVTRHELDQLGLTTLIGTESLRSYMHGYFINLKLYNKVKSAHDSNTTTYQNVKTRILKEKMKQQHVDRVKLLKLPNVNKELAETILTNKSKITMLDVENPIGDERFKRIFENPDFQIEATAHETSHESVDEVTSFNEDGYVSDEVYEDSLEGNEMETSSFGAPPFNSLTVVSNQYQPFSDSLDQSSMTIEQKLKQSRLFKIEATEADLDTNKEHAYVPINKKQQRVEKSVQKLRTHVEKKQRFEIRTKHGLPKQTRKLLRKPQIK